MTRLLLVLILLPILCRISLAGLTEQAQQDSVKAQLIQMTSAFMKEDVEHFVGYLSPAFLGMLGGKDSVIRMMQKDISKIVRAINRYRVGTPTKIFKTSSDLQCLISDTVVYEMTPTIIEQELALSTDGGSHWVFINAGAAIGNLAQFKSLLPTLAPEAEAELKRRMNVK